MERWIKLIVRDPSDQRRHGEIILNMSNLEKVVTTYENDQFSFAELCLKDNKYYIDEQTVAQVRTFIEQEAPIAEFAVQKYRAMTA